MYLHDAISTEGGAVQRLDEDVSVSPTLSPFLKWAGGKRWLSRALPQYVPRTYGRYLEPFLGGASSFFTLQPASARLSDLNTLLICAYLAMRDRSADVQQYLMEHAAHHSDSYYYEIRSKNYECEAALAAQLIYLNRTCWNGLYRVNLKGEFNVPRGSKNQVILATDDFNAYAEVLQDKDIVCCDFEETIDLAKAGDFIFADPPYTVAHNNNGFLKYNERIFSFADQIRLRDALLRAVCRGAKVVVTNAAHSSVLELYEGHGTIYRLTRASVLAASPRYRSPTEELLITMGY